MRKQAKTYLAMHYEEKIWLFFLACFWFMYGSIVSRGDLPIVFSGPVWRTWAAINGALAFFFFLREKPLNLFWIRLAVGSVVSFCLVRSGLLLVEGLYAVVPVWGIIATLSLHSYKMGRKLSVLIDVLDGELYAGKPVSTQADKET